MSKAFYLMIIVIIFLSFGCGSSGGSGKQQTPSGPAKVIVDGNIDIDVSANNWSADFQSTNVYFIGNLKNIGGKTALYPRIYFYGGKENTLRGDVCPQTHILHPNNTTPFKVSAKFL